jgi:hypothetical protein
MEANVDGRESTIGTGPRNKEGGLQIELYQRDDGGVMDSVRIDCWVNEDKSIFLRIIDQQSGDVVFERKTVR